MNLEIFSCSGGMAEGLRRAGITFDLAFDFDKDACDSYERNLGHRPVQVDARDLLRMVRAGWRPAPVDLLVADPPCTPWSRAGKRLGQVDERDMLDVTVELIRLLRPRAYLVANVPGLDDGPNLPIVQRTIGALSQHGYCVRDFARLDAADYGVPQHRVRPFWYGHRGGDCIRWPSRSHGAPDDVRNHVLECDGISDLRPWVTCRDALGHLSRKDLGSGPVRLRWRGCNGSEVASTPDKPARVVGTSTLSDGNVLTSPEHATLDARKRRQPGSKPRASHLDEPAHVLTTRDSSGDGATLYTGPNHRPSRPRIGPHGHHGKSFLSSPNAIKLSERAAAIPSRLPRDVEVSWQDQARTVVHARASDAPAPCRGGRSIHRRGARQKHGGSVSRYAEGTTVAVERTRAEIERLVRNRGATAFGSLSSGDSAAVLFEVKGRRVRFELPVPPLPDPRKREAEERRRWRCLLLAIKAKFETVANGIATFDEEFLANIILPGSGETVGAWAAPRIADAYARGLGMPPLLEAGGP